MGLVEKILAKRKVTPEQLEFYKAAKLQFPELDKLVNDLTGQFFLQDTLKVGILYDTDVDGLFSGYILEDFLGRMGKVVVNFINPMKKHGISKEAMDWVGEQQLDWLFVVDAGSGDVEEMKRCVAMGTNVVVLDHHPYEPQEYDEGIWVVNISKYPELPAVSGCGVVYRFLELVGERFGMSVKQYETYVGITILSDMCTMDDPENRYYVSQAYEGYRDSIFLQKFRWYGSHRSFYGWGVSPYLNALIRTGEEKRAVMVVNNMDRRAKMTRIPEDVKRVKARQKEMVEELFSRGELKKRRSVTLHLRKGVDELATLNGLVANGLVKEYGKSALVMAYDAGDKLWKGSFRGLHYTEHTLREWGFWTSGHPKACGVKISNEGLKTFYRDFVYRDMAEREKADLYINQGQLTTDEWLDIATFNEYSGTNMPEIVVEYKAGVNDVDSEGEIYGVKSLYVADGEIKDFTAGVSDELRVVPILDKSGHQLVRA